MIEGEALKAGWTKHCSDLEIAYRGVDAWIDDQMGIQHFNKLAALCASAYTIGFAGRGSAPERINAASVLTSPTHFVVDDKLTDGAKSGRLLPHTSITASSIVILCAAKDKVRTSLMMPKCNATDSLFSGVVRVDSGDTSSLLNKYKWAPLSAANLSDIANDYYEEDLNFQRNFWVTDLDQSQANRWAIRALTGHGSHLLGAFAPGMNVSPREGLAELKNALEQRYAEVLGGCSRLLELARRVSEPVLPVFPMDLLPAWDAKTTNQYVSADPLAPMDRQCLIDWRLTNHVRNEIAEASITVAIDGQILLSLLCHTGMPEADIAIRAASDNSLLKFVGATNGISWNRFYYSHEFWLPLQKPTLALLKLRGEEPKTSRDRTVSDTAQYLRSIPGYSKWPQDDQECIERFAIACERWRRVELPPSISTMASSAIQTSCLSPMSLFRLANPNVYGPGEVGNLAKKYLSTTINLEKNHGLKRITTIVNKWADQSESNGGRLARAQELKSELTELGTHRSSVFNFSVSYIVMECEEIIETKGQKGKLSTLATRWSTLHPTLNSLDSDCDPQDFEDDEFIHFAKSVNEYCLAKLEESDKQYVLGNGELTTDRARDALQRFFHVLTRNGWDISELVWESIGGAVVRNPRTSASATLILDKDLTAIAIAAKQLFPQEPHLSSRLATKVRSMSKVPQRIGEASAVPSSCITQTNALVICKTPFTVDKSDRTSRVTPISADVAAEIEKLIEETLEVDDSAEWLYRFDDKACTDDQRVNRAISDLIRLATKDPQARTHSLRANAYMEIIWPGWQEFFAEFLAGRKDCFDCVAWLKSLPIGERWTLPIYAGAAAGHGAVDPGYRHYGSAWPLVYAAYLQATLSECQPGQKFITQMGVKPNTLTKAKSRRSKNHFDAWSHLLKCKPLEFATPQYTPTEVADSTATDGAIDVLTQPLKALPFGIQALKYICLRACGWSDSKAGHEVNVHGIVRECLELHNLSKKKIEVARERKKSTHLGTALNSDIDSILLDTSVSNWVMGMSEDQYRVIFSMMFRVADDFPGGTEHVQLKSVWETLLQNVPNTLAVHARFGRGDHLSLTNDAELHSLAPMLTLGDRHRDLGPMPEVLLMQRGKLNYVVARRLTSLLKLLLLARTAVREAERTLQDRLWQSKNGGGSYLKVN